MPDRICIGLRWIALITFHRAAGFRVFVLRFLSAHLETNHDQGVKQDQARSGDEKAPEHVVGEDRGELRRAKVPDRQAKRHQVDQAIEYFKDSIAATRRFLSLFTLGFDVASI